MMSYESDVHQMATDFLRQVQSGQRARKGPRNGTVEAYRH
jgi:hypothetical protein